jgi:hypothetical protein
VSGWRAPHGETKKCCKAVSDALTIVSSVACETWLLPPAAKISLLRKTPHMQMPVPQKIAWP